MSATIELRAAAGVRVRGMVVDEAHEPVAGVRVAVVEFDEHAETSADGAFSLPARSRWSASASARPERWLPRHSGTRRETRQRCLRLQRPALADRVEQECAR